MRQPEGHPSWVAFLVWLRSRRGELGPVVGACPACTMPLVGESGRLPPDAPWTLETPRGPLRIGAEELVGPSGPMDAEQAEAWMREQLVPRAVEQLADPRLLFVAVVVGILALIALVWLGAALYVLNFLFAMGTQGNFSAPAVP